MMAVASGLTKNRSELHCGGMPPGRITMSSSVPAWPPDALDLRGLAYTLSISTRQARRLLSAGRLPPADIVLGTGIKARRWSRRRVLRLLAGQGGAK